MAILKGLFLLNHPDGIGCHENPRAAAASDMQKETIQKYMATREKMIRCDDRLDKISQFTLNPLIEPVFSPLPVHIPVYSDSIVHMQRDDREWTMTCVTFVNIYSNVSMGVQSRTKDLTRPSNRSRRPISVSVSRLF
jgi:hypothetical protein